MLDAMRLDVSGPHSGQPLLTAGEPLDEARAVVVLAHGRGGTARDMLLFGRQLGPGLALLAPQAAGQTWYPYGFMAPLERNEPWLSSALDVIRHVVDAVGAARETLIVGFSQGACLVSESVARHPAAYGGVAVLSGGLIGPPGTPRDHEGSLAGVPVFLGCSDVDPHIPVERVHETEQVLSTMGASTDARIYPGMGHTVNADEVAAVMALADRIRGGHP